MLAEPVCTHLTKTQLFLKERKSSYSDYNEEAAENQSITLDSLSLERLIQEPTQNQLSAQFQENPQISN